MSGAGDHKSVFLVGFMGAGKTSVGRTLAQRLGWRFEDLDDRIEAIAGRSIAEIFRDSGETEFRRQEREALRELMNDITSGSRIVALGGGAFVQRENVGLLEMSRATVVFLDGAAEELFLRCEQEQRKRPLLHTTETFRELYEQRRSSYLKAGCRIDTSGKNVDQVVAEVAWRLELE